MFKNIPFKHTFAKSLVVCGTLAALASPLLLPSTAMAATGRCVEDVHCVIAVGDKDIADRQLALDKLNDRVTVLQSKHDINDDQASVIHLDVRTHHDSMADLKAKLDATTTIKDARMDVKAIYEHRIYAVVLPRDYRHLHLDVAITLHDKLADLKPALESSIDKASADQQAQLNPLFTDYKNDLVAAEGQIDQAQSALPTLNADNYNTNRVGYETSFKQLTDAEKSLHATMHGAAADLHKIKGILDAQPAK